MNVYTRVKRLLRQAPELAQRGARVRAFRQQQEHQEQLDPNDPSLVRRQEVAARFEELVQAANEFIREEDAGRVQEGVTLLEQRRGGSGYARGDWPGSPWCWDDGLLECGRSRLPPDLSPALMCRLMVIRLTERHRLGTMDVTCLGCGLQLPRDKSAPYCPAPTSGFFPCCPHCGGTAMQWAILVEGQRYPWMDLPGYVGRRSAASTSATV